ncbi:hypothetical protein EIB18_03320 [Caulobacter vibrioides]|uniref:Uncharacterized protein n=2 Tax=Caulobacter vibrioides TaxID=155892 RepID=Q9AAH9_CAUVC|nr:hypothetical protein [Caulobacter vibrioides]YP_002516028.1 hypothetical protein CCNA_00655 [Caulobacter vibrioides NA1000]AAK22604.1 hypothetical protein CC_0619 [Caulobacter vibrioides CB15]ACL94120.1 hypothetical protein CCNA_00655 [Caulobacter vibrioides NA1000]ATC27464.1 hypothetical protein CA607_03305 [Caulobacter vibrioides]AZH11841.1 hypothetical protein EIB18_03320 [Caulobacter vibrioides]QXZ52701.1 hypothetical protein KZH45_03200 [Caulobacter vibrioides]
MSSCMPRTVSTIPSPATVQPIKRRGRQPRPIEDKPKPLWTEWEDPDDFASALDLQMKRHGDSAYHLQRALAAKGPTVNVTTLRMWRIGAKSPNDAPSMRALGRIEARYDLPTGYFRAKIPPSGRAVANHRLPGLTIAERRRLAWHLPDDFSQLPLAKREEILDWVRTVIVSGSTEYRRYQAAAMRQRFAVRFSASGNDYAGSVDDEFEDELDLPEPDAELVAGTVPAPAGLDQEMAGLLAFKTAALTSRGLQRSGVWGSETASQKVEHLGLMFGALASAPTSQIAGAGVPLHRLTFALLVIPAVWDWYLQWRQGRRGFYTQWEVEMLMLGAALTRRETGWIRQTPALAARLRPIQGLLAQAEIDAVRADWDAACDEIHRHALHRAKEVARIARVHRDPFEPIMAILEADSPLAAYRKITEEVLARAPDARRYPVPAAEASRAFLMLRFGLHLGVRQKNLRQLLICQRGAPASSERRLETLKCGELRWNEREGGWEAFIPAVAFKNAGSSYFGRQPFRLLLPDLGGLYDQIGAYLKVHRPRLLGGAADPGTFFVKTMKATSKSAAYDQNTFYEAWRLAIQRYGIFNPYTGRGAIEGLLPHGPHNVRDVLATHILKKTGSYEQASYAIQDTADTVAKHYGRFLPKDKAALAAKILNKAWEDA